MVRLCESVNVINSEFYGAGVKTVHTTSIQCKIHLPPKIFPAIG
jgi:hypothetical protein